MKLEDAIEIAVGQRKTRLADLLELATNQGLRPNPHVSFPDVTVYTPPGRPGIAPFGVDDLGRICLQRADGRWYVDETALLVPIVRKTGVVLA